MRAQKTRMLIKFCDLCKKHGGVHIMHNTSECHCYKKDRTPNVELEPVKEKVPRMTKIQRSPMCK